MLNPWNKLHHNKWLAALGTTSHSILIVNIIFDHFEMFLPLGQISRQTLMTILSVWKPIKFYLFLMVFCNVKIQLKYNEASWKRAKCK